MRNKKKISIFLLPLIIALVVFVLRFWAQECTEYEITASESFDTTTYKDPASSVDHWGDGYITLNKLGANFATPVSLDFPTWINTVTANDFNGDGWPDLVGSSSSYSNVLVFIENMGDEGFVGTFSITQWIDGSTGPDGDGNPITGVQGQALDNNGHCGMTSGDYDGDGDIDFIHVSGESDSPNTPERIWLYENHLNEGSLDFTQTDMTSTWAADVGGFAWTATFMTTTDFDKDGDLDILAGNGEGEVILFRNTGNGLINSSTFILESEPVLTTGWTGHGVSTISIADLDMDGDDDIIVGSVDYGKLKYFKNDGSGNFFLYTEYDDPSLEGESPGAGDDLFDGASTVSLVADFDLDGDPDLMFGTDNWNYRSEVPIGGLAYFFRNVDGDLNSTLIFDDRDLEEDGDPPKVWDFDMGEVFDFDMDGDMDFLMADGNHSEKYYVFRNDVAPVYNLEGTGISKDMITALDPTKHAVTKVQITQMKQSVLGDSSGCRVEIWVSNDGITWEFYVAWEGADIKNYADPNLPDPHSFTHFGSQLRWKAVLTAEEDAMEEYEGASYDTPKIEEIDFEITYVDQREYSRTSVATTVEGVESKKLIIGGSFIFPGWKGYLRAYDVTTMGFEQTADSVLKTVTRPDLAQPGQREIVPEGVEIFWDAGELLVARAAASRVIYTAIDEGAGLVRWDFTLANVDTLDDYLQDFNGDNTGLINFVRGEGRSWKLGDINHSNPIVVGPPSESASLMGSGYDTFKDTWKDRQKVLYVGANEGMIHCFDVNTGEELWAYIPYNLLPMVRDQWAVDPSTGARVFVRRAYVDSSPVVEDVYIDADGDTTQEWITILVCGQGRGQGSTLAGGTSGNFYFALDVTDPSNPKPLWEFTDNKMGETWSVPVIGKIQKDGADTWAGFVGSGYDNVKGPGGQGNVFSAFDLETGTLIWEKNTGDVDTEPVHGWNIKNSLAGSPSLVDTDSDGYTDSVYFGDLDGRLWKVDVTANLVTPGSWSAAAIYTDSNNYPILTKPAIWLNPLATGAVPHIYFGTGGDDRAPDDVYYSLIAFVDGATPEVEWYVGDQTTLGLAAEKDMGDLLLGEKVWADPKVADKIVYFSTLQGSIEAVNPCENIEGQGTLYARWIQPVGGAAVGGTALKTAGGPTESLNLEIKTRAAVTLGDSDRTRQGRKREVYIQEYDSTLQRLEQWIAGILEIKSWREIFRVIR